MNGKKYISSAGFTHMCVGQLKEEHWKGQEASFESKENHYEEVEPHYFRIYINYFQANCFGNPKYRHGPKNMWKFLG